MRRRLVLLNYMNFQIVKINAFHKAVGSKAGLGMTFELSDGQIQPDGLAQVELIAGLL